MAESPSALPDEQLRCLSPADQAEILNAVAQGRAVSDARLAPLAVAYAHRWHSVGGTRLYRSVWYLGVAALVLAVSFTAAEWPGVVVCAAVLALCPQLSRRRIARAWRAEAQNRELLGWAPHPAP